MRASGPTYTQFWPRSDTEIAGGHMASVEYVLGTSQEELERLIWQDRMILRPITEQLLHRAGVRTVMRVLDLGCGTGGFSMLAASLLGPRGSVVVIDQSPEPIALSMHCPLEIWLP